MLIKIPIGSSRKQVNTVEYIDHKQVKRTRVIGSVSSWQSYTRGRSRPRAADGELGTGGVELCAEGSAGGVEGEEFVAEEVATGCDIRGNGHGPGVLSKR